MNMVHSGSNLLEWSRWPAFLGIHQADRTRNKGGKSAGRSI